MFRPLWGLTTVIIYLCFSSVASCPAVPDARPARGNMDSAWQRLHSRFVAEVGENDSAEVRGPILNILEQVGPVENL
jgi:hypothetical protein